MFAKYKRFRIGFRTIKTAVAVIIAMLIVTSYGATTSKLIFAMLGAMAAMEHTFKESLESWDELLEVLEEEDREREARFAEMENGK